jgi:hypothetical protein
VFDGTYISKEKEPSSYVINSSNRRYGTDLEEENSYSQMVL